MGRYVDGIVLPVPRARLADTMHSKDMPFDGKRMFWGCFKTLVEL